MENFEVVYRSYGHWDIYQQEGRIFTIRGGPGKYCVFDEREDHRREEPKEFKTVQACMSYICDDLMFELTDNISIGSHECKESPIGICFYNNREDPVWDNCLICGDPHERK